MATLPPAAVFAAGPGTVQVQVVDDRGMPVSGAVVEIDAAGSGGGPVRFPWQLAVAQKNQQFVPGTLIVPKGSKVAFPNLDKVRHSIYSFSKPAKFQIDLYGRDQSRSQAFPIAGTVALGCNIHDKMRGYIRVVDTQYAGKTDQNGMLTIAAIPGGAAKMVVWHPQLRAPNNELSQAINVVSGKTTRKVVVKLR